MPQHLYADAESTLSDARIAIIGAPFERTTCHRKGCAEGPRAMREESYNFETYISGADLDFQGTPICDCGDISGEDLSAFASNAHGVAREVASSGAFPILLGGEHAVTPLWLGALMDKDPWGLLDGARKKDGPGKGRAGGLPHDFCIVIVDAHMDFRDGYLGEPLSHAAATRRVCDLVEAGRVIPFGIRSHSIEEKRDAESMGLRCVWADTVRGQGVRKAIDDALEGVPSASRRNIYLSLDIDGIDPAYAPGVGTPEPFGLTPLDVRELIRHLASRLIGFDVVEVCPPKDNGNTAALGCRLISEVMAHVVKRGR